MKAGTNGTCILRRDCSSTVSCSRPRIQKVLSMKGAIWSYRASVGMFISNRILERNTTHGGSFAREKRVSTSYLVEESCIWIIQRMSSGTQSHISAKTWGAQSTRWKGSIRMCACRLFGKEEGRIQRSNALLLQSVDEAEAGFKRIGILSIDIQEVDGEERKKWTKRTMRLF